MAYFQQTEFEYCEDRIYGYPVKATFTFILRYIKIDAKLITKGKDAKSPGVIIDEYFSRSNHISELSKKISSAIGALKRIRPYISSVGLTPLGLL